ncbi:MAG: hypothetical protein B1H04_01800 [Planctomycetales bacterium 4484_123]|nr:MAG: hypothetical protein B1H04_01800 [Planctomycetales bacterium 4484_123]
MAATRSNLRRSATGYLQRTRQPLTCLLFILPMLAAYEAGAIFFGHKLLANEHLKELLGLFGATGWFLPPFLVVTVLFVWHVVSKQKWQADVRTLLGMAAESILWALPLVVMAGVLTRLMGPGALSAGAPQRTLAANVLSGIGAGVYEEFLFRLAGIALFLLLTVDAARQPEGPMIVLAVILTSVLFSFYHFLGPESFSTFRFVFRVLAGAYLAVVYVYRGFGIAVGAHACYNAIGALWTT